MPWAYGHTLMFHTRAHEQILMDPEKRKMYDEYGEDALRDGGASGMHDPFDIFNSFFGGGGGGGGQ